MSDVVHTPMALGQVDDWERIFGLVNDRGRGVLTLEVLRVMYQWHRQKQLDVDLRDEVGRRRVREAREAFLRGGEVLRVLCVRGMLGDYRAQARYEGVDWIDELVRAERGLEFLQG